MPTSEPTFLQLQYADHVGESDFHWPIDFPNAFRETKEPEIIGGFSIRPNLTLGIRPCYRL